MLAQLKLAWWRDRLSADPEGWPRGEPMLARLAVWENAARGLLPLVDGWEALLDEQPLSTAALTAFAEGRADAMAALAARLGADRNAARTTGRRWALADRALRAGPEPDGAAARRLLAEALPATTVGTAMRPLAVLAGLSERAVRRGEGEALAGPSALFAALRLGLLGR